MLIKELIFFEQNMEFDLVCSKLDSLLFCGYLVTYCDNSLKTYNQIDLLKFFNIDIQPFYETNKPTFDFILLMLINFYNEEYIRIICKRDYFETPDLEISIRSMKENFYFEIENGNSINNFLFINNNYTNLGITRNYIRKLLKEINFNNIFNHYYLKYICDSEYRKQIKRGSIDACNILVQNLNFDIINDFINIFKNFDNNINKFIFNNEYVNKFKFDGGNIDMTQIISVIRGETLPQNYQQPFKQ